MPGEKDEKVKPQTPEGEQDQSSSGNSSGGEAQSVSTDFAAALEKQMKDFDSRLRAIQSGSDKQIKAQVNNSIERILQLAGEGKDPEQIKRELWIDQQMQGTDSADSSHVSDKDEKKESSPDVSRVVDQALNLPQDDPRVTDLKLKYGSDPVKYIQEGLKLKVAMGEQSESTPGEQPLPQGGQQRKEENSIANIDDPKTLYRMAAQDIAKKMPGRSQPR